MNSQMFSYNLILWLSISCLLDFKSFQCQSINVVTFAGTGATTPVTDGPAVSATFNGPRGLTFDSLDNCYVSDWGNHRIRKITKLGVVSTFAGSGSAAFADGTGLAASFSGPTDVDTDVNNNLYIADTGNNRIRLVTPAGVVTTFAGTGTSGSVDGFATSATFTSPHGLAVDKLNSIVYIADTSSHKIRKIQSGTVTTVAGNGSPAFADGPASSASFNTPHGVDFDSSGNVYVADYFNNRVRKISVAGIVTTIGGGATAGSADGALSTSTMYSPHHIKVVTDTLLYLCETDNSKIRVINLNTKTIMSFAGTGTGSSVDGANTVATFAFPDRIRFDSSGYAYVAERTGNKIRKIASCTASAIFDAASKVCTCNAGYQYLSNGTCVQCPVGTESNSDKTLCTPCGVGKYRTLAMSSCASCAAGTEPNSDGSACVCTAGKYLSAGSCVDCPLGKEPNANRTLCFDCAAGKFRPKLAYGECLICPLFATCNTTSITACQAGSKIDAFGLTCEQCPLGTQSSADMKSCVSCSSVYTFRSSLTQATCQTCPTNSACTPTGFTCNAAYESTSDGLGCSQCMEGYAKASPGNTACSQCPTGQESAGNKQTCIGCGTGKYRPSQAHSKCIPCPSNGICSASALQKCIDGWKINSSGDGCEQCLIGQDSDGLTCVGCQAGYVKPDQSYNICVGCPQGYSSCGGSSLSCQTGFYFDKNVQCKRNDTYFALQQTATNSVSSVTSFITVTQPSTVFVTAIQPHTVTAISQIVNSALTVKTTVSQTLIVISSQTVTQTVTQAGATVNMGAGSDSQNKPVNSVTLDFLGTLPISPMVFGIGCIGVGCFVSTIMFIIFCRTSARKLKKDEEYDGMTTGMNTTSQRTFTNSTVR